MTFRKWIKDGWNHYSSLATGQEAGESGVIITSGYLYFNDAKEVHLILETFIDESVGFAVKLV